ncbi:MULTISPECIES: hypothetical protein [unclassified Oceanispirochaeta]|uniref:hypothetical protein n=1 Tax=unclassified Oceanispirochaeta TaxID=2635722 RepID=UPI000E0916BE|nr:MULTISPECIES: hypothetical protein [unclassified Oceanispirochaeta]MBF9016556.1 hypothetical protein [Oceanispirochaeta sp. M2]NPD73018.1 hypothetical protein [Oceanispirochaeta sp. M1]RDG31363.1 hypothetical protein DV872_12995 [Oceanispirochaeta sp. M1]
MIPKTLDTSIKINYMRRKNHKTAVSDGKHGSFSCSPMAFSIFRHYSESNYGVAHLISGPF